jgi:chemotaxis protein histidine kinase CheA
VALNGGMITVESEVGVGTTFNIILPFHSVWWKAG